MPPGLQPAGGAQPGAEAGGAEPQHEGAAADSKVEDVPFEEVK